HEGIGDDHPHPHSHQAETRDETLGERGERLLQHDGQRERTGEEHAETDERTPQHCTERDLGTGILARVDFRSLQLVHAPTYIPLAYRVVSLTAQLISERTGNNLSSAPGAPTENHARAG